MVLWLISGIRNEPSQDAKCTAAFAGKPGSHRSRGVHKSRDPHISPVGAGLARESAGSVNKDVGCTNAIVGKPAPASFCGVHRSADPHHPLWEPGLPAKAPVQSIKMLDAPTPSLASKLPQVFAVYTDPLIDTIHCGSGLARESAGSVNKDVGCTNAIAGKPAPTSFCGVHRSADLHHPLWERACPRKRCISRWRFCLCRRFREQARSHSFSRCFPAATAY